MFYDQSPLSLANIHESRILQFSSHVFKLGGKIQKPEFPHEFINEKTPLVLSSKRHKRKIINEIEPETGRRIRWPNSIVPFELDESLRELSL